MTGKKSLGVRIRTPLERIFCAVAAACLFLGTFCVSGAGSGKVFRVETEPELRQGERMEVRLCPDTEGLASFLLRVEYDPGEIRDVSVTFEGKMKDAYTYTVEEEGLLSVICTAKDGPFDGNSAVCFRFLTEKETEEESVSAAFELLDAADEDARRLTEGESYTARAAFAPGPSAECALLRLDPESGELDPPFSPDVFDYALEVPFSVSALEFDTETSAGATVRVNRKNLGAGGSTVDFVFTVTAEDGKTKAEYRVSVTRQERGSDPTETPKPTATPKAAATEKPAGTASSESGGSGGEKETAPKADASPDRTAVPTQTPSAAAGEEQVRQETVYITRESGREDTALAACTAGATLLGVCVGGGLVLAARKLK